MIPISINFRFLLKCIQDCKQSTDWLIFVLFQLVEFTPWLTNVVKCNSQTWVSDNGCFKIHFVIKLNDGFILQISFLVGMTAIICLTLNIFFLFQATNEYNVTVPMDPQQESFVVAVLSEHHLFWGHFTCNAGSPILPSEATSEACI